MKSKVFSILVVEDDLLARISLKSRLEAYGAVYEASTSKEALTLSEEIHIDLAFVDLDLEVQLAGLNLLNLFSAKNIHTVVLSGREDDEVITKAYGLGCSDYLSKPYNKESVDSVIAKYKNAQASQSHLLRLKDFFMTNDPSIISQLQIIEQAIFGFQPILIKGETGTGKTFLAKFIHELVGKEKPFIHLNCSEIAESLIESELFGHSKGSFTGAIKDKKGLLELADGGILFLDEIATLPLTSQKKLLKALEEKYFYPVGSEKSVKSTFRLISATCEDLNLKVENGEFRRDFLFRIEGFNVVLKSLRERRGDLLNIVNVFLKKGNRRIILSADAKEAFLDYSWPGNIRELEKTIDILKSRSTGVITLEDLKGLLQHGKKSNNLIESDINYIKSIGLNSYIEMLEEKILETVLKENNDKVRKTMADLKISNNSFYRIMTNVKARVDRKTADE